MKILWMIFFLWPWFWAVGGEADWSQSASLSYGETRGNIFQLNEDLLESTLHAGRLHSLHYPVNITGLLIPVGPMKRYFDLVEENTFKSYIFSLFGKATQLNSMTDLYSMLGLMPYPKRDEQELSKIPYPNDMRPDYAIGASFMKKGSATGMTFSCAACHVGQFLGRPVFGMPNKITRANDFFTTGKTLSIFVRPHLASKFLKLSSDEKSIFVRSINNIRSVGAKTPAALGLDTSLAQVALSLARRNKDPYATKSKRRETLPPANKLRKFTADSKPMPWWNLKYKTRWLSDGSIISGNPILTNFLWNEIGRGADLKELEAWMKNNTKTVQELTAAVFAAKAPFWTDFFQVSTIDIDQAKRGEKIYLKNCKRCHGRYQKAWASKGPDLSLEDKIKTTKVFYHERTPVKNVGTDPNRYLGMKVFAKRLNQLKISKWMKTVVEPQKGYVPPPLEGIWLRFPYFHNNSIPNLCALFLPERKRPKTFYVGRVSKEDQFDEQCVGLYTGDETPREWRGKKSRLFDARKPGLSNVGHTKEFFKKDGRPKFSEKQKFELIEFLKTL